VSISPSELQPPPGSTHSKKRVGRGPGSGKGTYAGKGLKGQSSRSGKTLPYASFQGGQFPFARKFHTLRGFNNKWRTEYQPVNLTVLERFEDGTTVTPETLREIGVLKHLREPVKVLGEGELTKRLNVTAHRFSASAKSRIEELGGTATLVAPVPAAGEEG
jgi:large subunit ribosomal protein L15